ncbi:pilus assembly protein CpaE [Paractinoplanes deccanensis]|uniref:Pilus assembly protein CpaE n=1 Tax=Paractinoplanes deccanensis TaxID=113561 RepID=A0ABQ3Y511_9ACTN|nr:P-loop NTPase [Actinoplanes deccanensis]GID75086.1 pilus assembly protein CpaE [Actinoplanes deccanensis]
MSLYVYVEPDDARRSQVGPGFREAGCTMLDAMAGLEAHLRRYPETLLVILGATVDLEEALMVAAYQRLQRPLIGVVLIRKAVEPDTVLRCLRSGVREIVAEDDEQGLREATIRSVDLSKALSTTVRTSADNAPHGRVVTLFSGKGGNGRSMLATNLAVALAGGGRRVLLIDLDLQFGDIAIMLKLAPERHIAGGVAMAGRLDEPGLRSIVTPYRPGVDALLAPPSPAEGEKVSREFVVELLDAARPFYDFIVVDTPAVVTDQVLAALDMTDWYVAIVTPDLPALKSARLTAEMFDSLDYPKDKRLTVLNRANTEGGLSPAEAERAVGMPFTVQVPSSRDVTASVNAGEPLVLTDPLHLVSRAVRALADRCAGVAAAPARRRRFLSRKGRS